MILASATRTEVRAAGRAARRAIEGRARVAAEAALVGHLGSLDVVRRADSVGVFVAHDGEPDLMPLVEQLWAAGQTVALPVLEADPNDYSMRFVPWRDGEDLHRGRYGIPIPIPNLGAVEAPGIELSTVLVSFTGFDADGGRMGRGAGFFDRYLAISTANVVGVGFEAQRFEQVPMEDHDVRLPAVVTDLGVRFLS